MMTWKPSPAVARILLATLLGVACTSQRGSDSAPRARESAAHPSVSASAGTPTPAARVQPRPWEHERSDIPPDPRIHFSALANGMRIAWMKNSEPKERCYLRLHVDVGSLSEEDDERGMAHFLEHMAFNGTKHWPGTSLVEWFQRHGMSFGADTNAHTGFSETVYEIDLPTSDPAAITEGLAVLRDFADGVLLEQKDVDEEKGVVDAEQRERDSPEYRILVRAWEIELDGTRIPKREPIGVKEVRAKFTSESVREFYRRWYRPENLTLILVGDLGELDPSEAIASAFGDLARPAGDVVPEPPVGTPTFADRFFSVYEKDASATLLALQCSRPYRDRPDDTAHAKSEMPVHFARSMLDLRLDELAKKEGAQFLSARTGTLREDGLRAEDGEVLYVTSTPENWAGAFTACQIELRRAIEHGFDESELAEVRADSLRALDEAVEREPTRSSASWVAELVGAAETRRVPASAETDRSIYRPLIEALDAKSCGEAFAKAWKDGVAIACTAGNVDLGADPGTTLKETYENGLRVPVEAREKETENVFAYSSDPARAGAIASRARIEDLDVEEVVFANGVRLHVKRTDFKEKQVLASVLVGEGALALERPAVEAAARSVFMGGGLGAHDEDELRRLTAGKTVGGSFNVAEQAFELSGDTTPEDLLLQCELLCARLTDPGWREEGMRQFQKQIPVLFERLEHDPNGPIERSFMPEFYSGDPRMKFPERAELEALTTEDVKAWLVKNLEDAPIDVVLVGDLEVGPAIQAVAQTFGALPERRKAERHEEGRKPVELAKGLERGYEVESDVEKSLVLIAFPAVDGRDTKVKRHIGFLGAVLGDRLRVEVREKLGASYSPGAGARLSDSRPNDGWIAIQAMAEPEKAQELVDACRSIANAMAESGLTAEEIDRQRKPVQASVRDRLRTNAYWRSGLARLHWNEKALDDMRSYPTFADAVQAADLDPLAKAYLGQGRASVALVSPRTKAAPEGEAGAGEASAPKKKE